MRQSRPVAVILLCLLAPIAASSQGPAPRLTDESARGQRGAEDRDTAQRNTPVAPREVAPSDVRQVADGDRATNPEDKPDNEPSPWWAVVTAALTALLAVIQTGVLIRQQRTLHRQTELMGIQGAQSERQADLMSVQAHQMDRQTILMEAQRKAAIAELRAYVVVVAGAIEIGQLSYLLGRVTLRNTGQTPALDLHASIAQWIGPFPPTVAPPEIVPKIRGSEVLGPGQEVTLIPPGAEAFPVQGARRESNIYVHGFIEYADVFGDRHRTDFCYMPSGRGDTMIATPQGNRAT